MCARAGAAAAGDSDTVRLADDMTRDMTHPADIDNDIEQQVTVSQDNNAPCHSDVSTSLQRHVEYSYHGDNDVSSHGNAEVHGNDDTGVVASYDDGTGVVMSHDDVTGVMTSRDDNTDVMTSHDDDTGVMTSYDDDTGVVISYDVDIGVVMSRDDDTGVMTSRYDDTGVVISYDVDIGVVMSCDDDTDVMTSHDAYTEQTEQLSDGDRTTVVTDMERDSDVMRPLDDVRDKSDSSSHGDNDDSSHGNDSSGIVDTGCQGDVDNDDVVCQGDIGGQIKGESDSSSQGDLDEFQGDSDHGDRQLMTSQPETVTSVTSRHTEQTEVTEDGGIVVTTTHQVRSSDPRHV